ncbi:MAG: flavin reductase [Chloroflexi bacterium]|nr:flavin reductase [Chloroflexota bacterium]
MDAELNYALLRNLASPIVAITSAWQGRVNAMVANSALRASLVPEAPRIIIVVSKQHLSHQLIWKAGAFCLHLLRTDQLQTVYRFGLFSGRDVQKLKPEEYTIGATGCPVLKDARAYFDCRVINTMDLGADTCFAGEALDAGQLSQGEVMTPRSFRAAMPAEWLPLYEQDRIKAQEFSRPLLHRIDYTPWHPRRDTP